MLLSLATLAFGAEVDLGVGLRHHQPGTDAAPWGAQVAGRVLFAGRFAVEADVFGRFPLDPVRPVDRTLAEVARAGGTSFRTPVEREIVSGQVLFEASPWRRERAAHVTVWGYGAVGATWRLMAESELRYDPASNGDVVLTPAYGDTLLGPVAGLGVETWFGERVGLRSVTLARPARACTGNVSPTCPTPQGWLALSVDLLVGF
ncbi:MAG: hypothetical protein ACK4YP_03185 [Myxococcota bacterium]